MLNIVIPMAGRGTRFKEVGYSVPKPLIPVNGKPMIQLVIENLRPAQPHRFIFIPLKQHLEGFSFAESLEKWAPGSVLIPLEEVTEGAACTVLLSRPFIDSGHPLLIANCDQWIDADINAFLAEAEASEVDGLIMTMKARDPKWSFVEFGAQGEITGVREKQVVSEEATVGIYYFRRGSDFVSGANEMIFAGERVNGEFYVAPVYNPLIAQGKRVGVFNVGSVGNGMHGLGTPADLETFLRNSLR